MSLLTQSDWLRHAAWVAEEYNVSIWSVHLQDPSRGMARMTLLPEGDWRLVAASSGRVNVDDNGLTRRVSWQWGGILFDLLTAPKPEELEGLDLYEHGKPVRLVTTQSWALVPREAP